MTADKIVAMVNKPNKASGDYTGDDGLLYCGKCRTPKQMRLDGRSEPVFKLCDCEEKRANAEKELQTQARIEELRSLCLPLETMRNNTFSAADQAKHIDIARRYVERWDEMRKEIIGLVFWGSTGTGKSFAAQCVANALIDKGIPVRYTTAATLISKLSEKDTRRDEYIENLRRVPLLIIDDVGAERDSSFAREQLCAAIDARTMSGRPLIITTNYTLDEMREASDPTLGRIFDRVLAYCVPVAVTGDSRRKTIGVEKLAAAQRLLTIQKGEATP